MQASVPQPDLSISKEPDDIDAALNELQVSLEGTSVSGRAGDITSIPELGDYLRFMKCEIMLLILFIFINLFFNSIFQLLQLYFYSC